MYALSMIFICHIPSGATLRAAHGLEFCTDMSALHTRSLTLAYEQVVIIGGVDVAMPSGQISALGQG